jgi:hypothetical protein
MMKRTSTFITAAAATVALAAGASPAVAGSLAKIAYGPVSYSQDPTGNGASDFWICSGLRLQAGATVQDHFHCTVTDQTFTGTFTASNPWPCGCTGWASDYDGAFTDDYVIRVSSIGTVVGTAIYDRSPGVSRGN